MINYLRGHTTYKRDKNTIHSIVEKRREATSAHKLSKPVRASSLAKLEICAAEET